MDNVCLSIDYLLDYKDDKDFGVKIFINSRDLRNIIRDIEVPYFTKQGNPGHAGGYHGLPPKIVFLPSRHFLDQSDPYYCDYDKRAIYRCLCGVFCRKIAKLTI